MLRTSMMMVAVNITPMSRMDQAKVTFPSSDQNRRDRTKKKVDEKKDGRREKGAQCVNRGRISWWGEGKCAIRRSFALILIGSRSLCSSPLSIPFLSSSHFGKLFAADTAALLEQLESGDTNHSRLKWIQILHDTNHPG